MKKRLLLLLLLFIMTSTPSWGQNGEECDVRDTLINFLILTKDLSDRVNKQNVFLFVNEIRTHKQYKNQNVGIFKFGTLRTHSYFHLLLKSSSENIVLVDMTQPYENVMLVLLEYFKVNRFYSKDEILDCIKRTTDLYVRNQKAIPWTL